MTISEKIELLENESTYKKIIKDSFGGVMYMVAKEEYNVEKIKEIIGSLTESEIDSLNGVQKGALQYVEII